MLGPPKTRDLARPAVVSVEALVPAGHFYRHLDAKLDLGFVRELVADRYAAGGRPSIRPHRLLQNAPNILPLLS